MTIQDLASQFQGASLAKPVEKHVRSQNEEQLHAAIQRTYAKFPERFRHPVESFSLEYPQRRWFGPQMTSPTLDIVFMDAIKDGKQYALEHGLDLSDDQALDIFNLCVIRIAHFAHSRPAFRKSIGIKKSWLG